MPFLIRPFRRFPVCCPETYQCGLLRARAPMESLAHGLALPWQSAAASRGSLLAHGEPADSAGIYVAVGFVRWVRGEEYGVETLVIDNESLEDMERYLRQQVKESVESIP